MSLCYTNYDIKSLQKADFDFQGFFSQNATHDAGILTDTDDDNKALRKSVRRAYLLGIRNQYGHYLTRECFYGKTEPLFLSPKARRIIRSADSIVSVVAMLCSLKLASIADETEPNWTYALLTYIFMAFSRCFRASYYITKHKLMYSLNICCALMFFGAGLAVTTDSLGPYSLRFYILALCLVLISDCVMSLMRNHKVRNILFSVIFFIAAGIYLFALFTSEDEDLGTLMMIHTFVVFVITLIHIISISFSQMRLGILRKIIRKTLAGEILLGLMLLVASFSFIFQALEPQIKTYSDGLWYSFAVVTTIGFGDITVNNYISRILSVILGGYGIVVVALITSVIVNFYNEVKDLSDDRPDTNKPDNSLPPSEESDKTE